MKKKLPIIIISVIVLSLIVLTIILIPKNKNKLSKTNLTTKEVKISSTIKEKITNEPSTSSSTTTITSTTTTTTSTTNKITTKKTKSTTTKKEVTTTTSKNTTTTKITKTTNQTTTKATTPSTTATTTTKTTTTKRTKINTETIEESEFVENKYGVDKTKVIKYKLITYSDNTTEKNKTSEYFKYNYAGFNATTEELKTEATTVANNNMSTYNEVVAKVNEYRAAAEAEPIVLDKKLCIAATIRAMELAYADKFDHTRPNGKSFSSILKDFNISYYTAGENIAAGQPSVNSVTETWYKSDGHRENMECKSFKKIGVGKYKLPNSHWGTYWVQIFTN